MKEIAVVTGANRGIGLAFCKQLHSLGYKVYGVCRVASEALLQSGVEVVDGVDISKPETIDKIRVCLAEEKISLLVNNAGILRNEVIGELNFQTIQEQFEVNALGPLRVTESLLDRLENGSKVAMITSRMGSIEDNTSGGRYGYRMSKCALNIASVSLAHDLKTRDICVGIYHPGLVGTDMIGGFGDITPEVAAERLLARIEELTIENTGSFWHSNGENLPW